eukprot:4053551-Alexandrium_andersonii.AAC.1
MMCGPGEGELLEDGEDLAREISPADKRSQGVGAVAVEAELLGGGDRNLEAMDIINRSHTLVTTASD